MIWGWDHDIWKSLSREIDKKIGYRIIDLTSQMVQEPIDFLCSREFGESVIDEIYEYYDYEKGYE